MNNFERELDDAKRQAQEEFYRNTIEPKLRIEQEQLTARMRLEAAKRQLMREKEQEIDAVLTPDLKKTVDTLLKVIGDKTWFWGRLEYGYTFEKNLNVRDDSVGAYGPKLITPSTRVWIDNPEVLASWQIGKTQVNDPDTGGNARWLARTSKSISLDQKDRFFLVFRRRVQIVGSEEYNLDLCKDGDRAYFRSRKDQTTTTAENDLRELLKRMYAAGPSKRLDSFDPITRSGG